MPPVSRLARQERPSRPSLTGRSCPSLLQDIVGRSSAWVTNALAQHPPFPHHLHSSLSPALSTPPISLSGSSYASTSSFASTHNDASNSSAGSFGATRINVASHHPSSRANSFAMSPGSPGYHGPSSNGNKPHHAQPSLAAMMANTNLAAAIPSAASNQTASSNHPQLVNFISSLFPYHATRALSIAHLIEIAIPHAPPIVGAMIDLPPTSIPTRSSRPKFEAGRTVYLHLPPLSPKSRAKSDATQPHHNVDIRDHLTSLLYLVSESLEASELVLVLKRNEREDEELRELLHALAYVGGGVLRRVKGGFDFDERSWVLVGIEV